jgi:hypothetical protein
MHAKTHGSTQRKVIGTQARQSNENQMKAMPVKAKQSKARCDDMHRKTMQRQARLT